MKFKKILSFGFIIRAILLLISYFIFNKINYENCKKFQYSIDYIFSNFLITLSKICKCAKLYYKNNNINALISLVKSRLEF